MSRIINDIKAIATELMSMLGVNKVSKNFINSQEYKKLVKIVNDIARKSNSYDDAITELKTQMNIESPLSLAYSKLNSKQKSLKLAKREWDDMANNAQVLTDKANSITNTYDMDNINKSISDLETRFNIQGGSN